MKKDKIPKKLFAISEQIVDKLKVFSRAHYALDYYFDDKNTPHLIEMNLCPGFGLAFTDKESKLFYFERLIDCIEG